MTAMVDTNEVSSFQLKATSSDCEDERGNNVELRDRALKLCREFLKGRWETVPEKDFQISVLGGGLSNKLYVCRIPPSQNDFTDKCPTTVILRIFGIIIQDFNAQIQESVVFSILSERKIGPKLYAVFPGGRLEEYIECRTLSTNDLLDPFLSECIAYRLANYHIMVMPVSKQPTTVINKLQHYYDNLPNVQFDDEQKRSLFKKLLQYDIKKEINYLNALIKETDSPVVFCHNDLQEGNLLHASDSCSNGNPIQIIDFEYSCYNYRGFDIGNHFCEWTMDYSNPEWPCFIYKPENYPTRQQQERFVKSYLKAIRASIDVMDEKWQVDRIVKEANRFALLSHLFWCLWSVMQAKMSDIGFGYMEYALLRIEAYMEMKNKIE